MNRFVKPLIQLALTFALGYAWLPGAWAQQFEPGAYPDRVVLTWSADPTTTQTVTWRTDASVTGAKAQVRLEDGTPDLETDAVEYPAETRPFTGKEGREDRYHHVTFTGLKPATVYVYRVGDGTHWSEWFQFQTAAAGPEPFSFIYLGDAQNDIKSRWSRAIRQAFRQQPDARFIIHAGDLINRSNTDAEWGEWHYGAGFIHSMVPALPVPGNHEYFRDAQEKPTLDPHWAAQFTLPRNGPAGHQESVYYVDYQGVRLIGLNSQQMGVEEGSFDTQVAWLEKLLQDNPQRWTVVFFHHPLYSTSKNRSDDNKEAKARLKALFDQYGVDLVFQGHDHTYARGKGPNATASGPVYVLSVAGPKMYKSDSERWMDVSLVDTQLYQTVQVAGDKLQYKAYNVAGKLVDSFELTK